MGIILTARWQILTGREPYLLRVFVCLYGPLSVTCGSDSSRAAALKDVSTSLGCSP